ncbi:organic solute transporter Ostalpha-domain-containing protein [Zychaea mexicana]|uniref:organic solute transporter Ostalpha-domain-containing protein n=1 Tax=Zychaea mexicana TaxID=64656 RepID=UPI0022FEAA77|nr:organic solute transporter Ostalpha-domain-containing protein [Zychaea mexicana]KAI9498573.1 organic solute transporter Ostalpha-domain-containing protein [Zychaea mexicana]
MSECPTPRGLAENAGFNPDFDLKQLVLDPDSNMHIWGWLVSGFLTLAAVTLTAHSIKQHLCHYYTPSIQRHKVRVLAYPAVYSALAWFSYLQYNYETVIMFFATLFESFAVYNVYMCLEAYLEPFRQKYAGQKIPITTKVFGIFKIHLNSKWGLHFRVITKILVLQYPVWNIINSLISIITQVKGVYCDGQFVFNGAYLYLVIINFTSLCIILMAMFTYLSVFNEEWHHGRIRAHAMFWCVKAPIMIIFYCGDILLAGLGHFGVIQDSRPQHSGGTFWPADAVKNGYYVLIICAVMSLVAIFMERYYGLDPEEYARYEEDCTWSAYMHAFADGYLAFIPDFFRNVFSCGGDTVVLAKKRMDLRQNHKRRLSEDERHLLQPSDMETAQPLEDEENVYAALGQRRISMDDDDEDDGRLNASSVPLKRLGISSSAKSDDPIPTISMPPAPRKSRMINHNDPVAVVSTTGSSHFQPHEISRAPNF